MFLEALCRRNPEFVTAVVNLHQNGELKANTYVLDYDAIARNIKQIRDEASRLNLDVYLMTKQIGRNSAILKLSRELGLNKIVAVDWMGAQQIVKNGGEIGHIGHLVQVPKREVDGILRLNPEVWTVFSYEKAYEINQSLKEKNCSQNVLLRVWNEGDTFYPGHEGGIHIKDVVKVAKKIESLPNINVVGVTSFPCLLFDEDEKKLYPTQNMTTIVKASELLIKNGFSITQINAPGTTSTVSLEILAKSGATHVEPGHGITGTTPIHAFEDLPEIPGILYLSEISHTYDRYAYFYGGGLYIDPVFRSYNVKALVGKDAGNILINRYEVEMPDPSSIDYYGRLRIDDKKVVSGDTVILCFRAQVFNTRSRVAVIRRRKLSDMWHVFGLWDASGNDLMISNTFN